MANSKLALIYECAAKSFSPFSNDVSFTNFWSKLPIMSSLSKTHAMESYF